MKEALKLALEALQDYVDEYGPWREDSGAQYALRVGKEALAQQSNEQVEPFGWGRIDLGAKMFYDDKPMLSDGKTFPLYTHPPVPYVVESRTAQPKDDCQYAKDIGMTEHRCVDKCYYENYPQPEQSAPHGEPVAWVCYGTRGHHDIDFLEEDVDSLSVGTKLYTTSPYVATPRQRKPLTDEQRDLARWNWMRDKFDKDMKSSRCKNMLYALGLDDEDEFDELNAIVDRAIEAKLKEKNGC